MTDDLLDAPLGRRRIKVPDCTCHYSGLALHTPTCERLVALVKKYAPPGLSVARGRVERS